MIPEIDKREFRYRYRKEFTKLLSVKKSVWFPHIRHSPMRTLVSYLAIRARIELGYSKNTAKTDILYLLTKNLTT